MNFQAFQDFYTHHAEDMDARWGDFIALQAEWILNRLKILYKPDASFKVIDLGCGTGEILSQITAFFPNALLHGVDGTSAMIAKAQAKLKNRAVLTQTDLAEFQFTDRFDVIISTTVLHHLESPMNHIESFYSGLAENGHIFLSEIAINSWKLYLASLWWRYRHKSHHHDWSEKDFRYFIRTCGLKIENAAILKPDDFWRLQIYHLSINDKAMGTPSITLLL
jgi:2-polyprenyl-3-methyl-5-hydroxy-6-metoxy-1,4-benzoquinol methylase